MRFLLPFKGLSQAKSRWGNETPNRQALVLELLQQNLDTVARVVGVENVFLVSPESPRTAIKSNYHWLQSSGSGLNQDLEQARRLLHPSDVPLGVLLPDLPLLNHTDVEKLVQLASQAAVVLCPDHRRVGTNAVALNPADRLPFMFEGASFSRYKLACRTAGVGAVELSRPGLANDCDEHPPVRGICQP